MSRVPITAETGIRTFFCGPESFTPDLAPIVGEAPELRDYFVAAGLNSIGILTGGGDRPGARPLDARTAARTSTSPAMNIDRLHAYQSNPEYRRTRTVESLGMVYQCHYPGRSMTTARGAKVSPVHAPARGRSGACFKDVSGWEGADWYAAGGHRRRDPGPLTWGRPELVAALGRPSTRPAATGVIVMDMSFMSKFRVQGRDAGAALERICRQPRRRRAGHDHLHPVAQRGRHARGRPDRRPSSTTATSGSSPPTPRTATSRRGCAATSPTPHAFVTDVTVAATRSSTCRARGRASCCSR